MGRRSATATWTNPPSLAAEWLELAAGLGTERMIGAGKVLFRQDEGSAGLFLLREGILKASAVTPAGSERLVEVMGPGTLFGEGPALEGGPRLVTVRAMTPARLVHYRSDRVRQAVEADGRIALLLLRIMALKQRSLMHRLVQASTLGPEERLLDFFARLAAMRGEVESEGEASGARLTHEELGGYLGLSRITVTRALARLRAAEAGTRPRTP